MKKIDEYDKIFWLNPFKMGDKVTFLSSKESGLIHSNGDGYYYGGDCRGGVIGEVIKVSPGYGIKKSKGGLLAIQFPGGAYYMKAFEFKEFHKLINLGNIGILKLIFKN